MSVAQAVMEIPAAHQLNVFGQFDCNIKKIERAFGVTFVNRGRTDWRNYEPNKSSCIECEH